MKKSGMPIIFLVVCIGVVVTVSGIIICVRAIRIRRARIGDKVGVKADKASTESVAENVVNDQLTTYLDNTATSADVPTANHVNGKLKEDTSVSIILTGSDPDGDVLIYRIVQAPSHGSLSGVGANLTYTPDLDYTGTDSFTYKVSDGSMDSDPATVTLSILAVNDPPTANQQSVTTKVNEAIAIDLSGDDPDSDTLEFSILTQPSHGNIATRSDFETTGKLLYTPTVHFTGTDNLSFIVSDGTADSDPAMVLINITPNRPPMVDLQSVIIAEDTTAAIRLTGSDPDGDDIVYSVVTNPSQGNLTGAPPRLTYVPKPNFNGKDTFTFKASDGKTDSSLGTVSITVAPSSDPPIANPDSITTSEDSLTSIVLTGIDPDEDLLTYSIVTKPSHGTLSGTGPNLTYMPNPNFNGQDEFTFKVHDGIIDSEPAGVSIQVVAVEDIPIANHKDVKVVEDTASPITLTGNDPDGDSLTFSVVKAPNHGQLSGHAPNLTYIPNPNFSWLDSFRFTVSDGKAESEPATVSIVVTPENDRPIAYSDSVVTFEDVPTSIGLAGTDPDGDPLTYSIVTGPASGTLSGTEPNLIYTPDPDFYGQDEFSFRVHDGIEDSMLASVLIKVRALEDVPTPNHINVKLREDTSFPITLSGIDPDNDPLTFNVVKAPSHGRLSGEAPNLTYTPDPNFSWLDSFSFTVSDGKAQSELGIVSISVVPVNDPPGAKDDNITTQEDVPVTIDILANDSEPDNEILKVSNVTQGMNGSVTINPDDTLTYMPNAEFHGNDRFIYTVIDGEGETDTATVKVVVAKVDDPPIITSSPITTAMVNAPYMYDVAAIDPDGTDELVYSLTLHPSGMTINSSTGLIKWIPTEIHRHTDHRVEIKVVNRSAFSVSGTQTFGIHVTPSPPKKAILTVVDGYDHRTRKRLSTTGATGIVQASDDQHHDIPGGTYMVYDFSDISIPTKATLTSVVIWVEHLEESAILFGKLHWAVGTNWPDEPNVWTSAKAPTREGKQDESVDAWDVTSFVDTPEKLRTLQLQIKNSDIGSRKKTLIDFVQVVVKWDWVTPAQKSVEPDDRDLVRYGQKVRHQP